MALPWTAVACTESAPRPDDKPSVAATASPSPAKNSDWPGATHDEKYRDAEKGVEAALEEKYGSQWRKDFADVAVHDAVVSVFTTWSPGAEARRRGVAVCSTVASHIQERAHKGQFPSGTEIVIYTEKSDSGNTMAYLDVTEGECRATPIFVS
ncbi:hypothetical protein GLX30_00020 [Streptomyces sp. Tu 2975]|uniref:hypothetical protein n=1 Tax=Streptomyces sp. Tu 2975 TaxID=2676871 RepID=UPI001358FB30|nr:hypothetical protein [Streptomyces sp. Tu 2975]QIP82733.1 hypothetical protein GLX30_00020 [Streptomyces sp. Tu 2975]